MLAARLLYQMFVLADDGSIKCEFCKQWLNGQDQWEDHKMGKKHKKNCVEGGKKEKKIGKGVETPVGTALLIEQSALLNDAQRMYMESLYRRGALRSTL